MPRGNIEHRQLDRYCHINTKTAISVSCPINVALVDLVYKLN